MQIQADLSGVPVVRPRMRQVRALGAAFAAGLGAGCWSGVEELKDIKVAHDLDAQTFKPDASKKMQREALFDKWEHAVGMSEGWIPGNEGEDDEDDDDDNEDDEKEEEADQDEIMGENPESRPDSSNVGGLGDQGTGKEKEPAGKELPPTYREAMSHLDSAAKKRVERQFRETRTLFPNIDALLATGGDEAKPAHLGRCEPYPKQNREGKGSNKDADKGTMKPPPLPPQSYRQAYFARRWLKMIAKEEKEEKEARLGHTRSYPANEIVFEGTVMVWDAASKSWKSRKRSKDE